MKWNKKKKKRTRTLCKRKTKAHKSVLHKAAAGNSRTRMKQIQLHKAVLLFIGFLFLHLAQYQILFNNWCGLRTAKGVKFKFSKIKTKYDSLVILSRWTRTSQYRILHPFTIDLAFKQIYCSVYKKKQWNKNRSSACHIRFYTVFFNAERIAVGVCNLPSSPKMFLKMRCFVSVAIPCWHVRDK